MEKQNPSGGNPLLEKRGTPYDTPPFDSIREEHYLPAFRQAIAAARAEFERIAADPEEPSFGNTVAAMERQGELLSRVEGIFFNLREADTSDRMEDIAMEIQPELTALANDVMLDERLFRRVKAVYDRRAELGLDAEDSMLLEETYSDFVRGGAALSEADKSRYRAVSEESGRLTLRFGQNVLAATNDFAVNFTDEKDVADLPGFVRRTMAADAESRGEEGWTVTLHAPSYFPYMTYSPDRATKERLWRAYNTRAVGGRHDNTEIVRRLAELRLETARLLGYDTYADYALERRMAGSRRAVEEFLSELLRLTAEHARGEYAVIAEYARANGADHEFMPWDWAYWSERYKKEHYAVSDEAVKPYLELERVREGVFSLAGRLYGLSFTRNPDIPAYHPDVTAYEVRDEAGEFLAVLYLDFFPRESKRGGAWMTEFRGASVDAEGRETRPLVSLVMNFTKPAGDTPSLLTFGELTTFLHEFGHALHGMLGRGRYESLTGTNVRRDFVELPSQLMENWATEKEFLDTFAVHYRTGERMPAELVDRLVASRNYQAAYANVRQLSFGLVDMAWHTLVGPAPQDVERFEKEAVKKTRILPDVPGTAFSPSFGHIFSGGYAAGYYGYKWAEVLEADAFSLFREKGVFSREVADSFRRNILEKGGSEPPMDLYVRFRGRRPAPSALLEKLGLSAAR